MGTGISGPAVAAASVGGLLVYAGFRGVSPLQALRDVSSGKPPAVRSRPLELSTPAATPPGAQSSFPDGKRGAVVQAAQKYRGDKYNVLRRRQPGYSDCSSFIDKALRDAGIKPPGGPWAVSADYRRSGEWRTIPASQAQPGDVCVSAHHIVLVTGAGKDPACIGQQRPGRNVQTGPASELMQGGGGGDHFRTWTGYSTPPGTGGGGGGGGSESW